MTSIIATELINIFNDNDSIDYVDYVYTNPNITDNQINQIINELYLRGENVKIMGNYNFCVQKPGLYKFNFELINGLDGDVFFKIEKVLI